MDIAGAHHHSGLLRTIPQATLLARVFMGILQGAGVTQSPMAVITPMETLINPDISRCFCRSWRAGWRGYKARMILNPPMYNKEMFCMIIIFLYASC